VRHVAAQQCPDGTPPPCGRRTAGPTPAGPSPTSVAVLTFAASGPDTSFAWIGDQLAEEISSALGGVGRLEVRSRTLVRRQERALTGNLRSLGQALTVRFLVEGTVQAVGGRLRVRSQLVRAQDGRIVWSRAFAGAADSLLDVQETIATSVAGAIAGELLPAEAARIAARPTRNDAAYRSFLRGNLELARRTEAGLSLADAAYEAALRFDPRFSRAIGRLAYTHALAFLSGWALPGTPRDSVASRGLALAVRALGEDSANTDALLARGYIRQLRDDVRGARDDFRRAVAIDPRSAEAWHRLGSVLALPGEQSDAIAAFLRAIALEPDRAVSYSDLTWILLQQGRVAEATFWSDSLVAFAPDHRYAWYARLAVRLMQRDVRGARAAFDRIAPEYRPQFWNVAADLLTMEGDTAGARRVVAEVPDRLRGPVFDAVSRLLLGDREGALDALASTPPSVSRISLNLTGAFLLGGRFDARGDPRYERFKAVCEAALR
jgi:TolB-like protein/Tfp pilus assembly protein PilF